MPPSHTTTHPKKPEDAKAAAERLKDLVKSDPPVETEAPPEGPAEPEPTVAWELVTNEVGEQTSRLEVPGGFLYKTAVMNPNGSGDYSVSTVFVPS
jgi:hypothetical protein